MLDILASLPGSWWHWISSITVQVSVLIGIVWAVDRGLRGRLWPDVLYVAWALVIARVFLPASLPSFVRVPDVTSIATATVPYMAIPAVPEMTMPAVDPGPAITMMSSAVAPVVSEPFPWITAGMILWMVGVLVMVNWIGWVALSYVRTWRTLTPATEEWIYEAAKTAARRVGLRRCPILLMSDTLPSAGVFGVFRPVVVVPSDTEPGVDTDHVLFHECAHIKRRDPLLHAISLVAVALFWFNPLMWLAHRRLTHLREICCDALVATILQEKTGGYRKTLLAVAEKMIHARPVGGVVGILGIVEESSMLVSRIQWLDRMLWKKKRARVILTGVTVVLMAVAIPVFSVGKNAVGKPGGGVLTMSDVDVPPTLKERVSPDRVNALRKAGADGAVDVEFVIDMSGDVTNLRIIPTPKNALGYPIHGMKTETNPEWRKAVLDYYRQHKYTPAMKDGKPVAVKTMTGIDAGKNPVRPLSGRRLTRALGTSVLNVTDVDEGPIPIHEGATNPLHLVTRLENDGGGAISVVFVVDETGKVKKARITDTPIMTNGLPYMASPQATNPALKRKVLEYCRNKKFIPAMKDGKPVAIAWIECVVMGSPPGMPAMPPRKIHHRKTASGETALKLWEVDVPPRPERAIDLRAFAVAVRDAGLKEIVRVLYIVNTNGKVEDWDVSEVKFSEGFQMVKNPVLEKIAADYFLQDYAPAKKNGKPVPVDMLYQFLVIGPKTK
jgi:beta-lactamase regulating signal transducer with metallopeptidase domain